MGERNEDIFFLLTFLLLYAYCYSYFTVSVYMISIFSLLLLLPRKVIRLP